MNINEMQWISGSFQAPVETKNDGAVQIAKEGKVTKTQFESTMDGSVRKDAESSNVYNRKLNIKEVSESKEASSLSASEYVANSLTGQDLSALFEEGTSLEDKNSSTIKETISRIKEERRATKESVERQVEKERAATAKMEEQAQVQAMQQRLENVNLPATTENVLRMEGALEMTMPVSSFSFSMKSQMIQVGGPVTPTAIGSVVGTKARGSVEQVEDLSGNQNQAFLKIENQVQNILELAGMPVSEENMEVAKLLFANSLPLTAENIKMYQSITELGNLDNDVLIDRLLDGMLDGFSPEQVDLTVPSYKEVSDKLDTFFSDDDVLLEKISENSDFPKNLSPVDSEVYQLRARRQLEEIRLQLTIPVARQIEKQGISIDINHLSEIVEALKVEEQNAAKQAFSMIEMEREFGPAQNYHDIVELKNQVMQSPVQTIAATLERGMTQTMPEFVASAERLFSQNVERFMNNFEAVGTEVRADLGDRISKAFAGSEVLLKEMNMAVNDATLRAVRILGYNQMEISEESIDKVVDFDQKLQTLISQMKPEVIAKMVQEGIDPRNLSMEELSNVLSDLTKQVELSDISYSKFIWKMDKTGGLTKSERSSMIGIYRFLDKIEKNDGQALGSLLRDNKEVTINNLLSGLRSRKAEGIDVTIDEEFGALTELVQSGESISTQMSQAFLQNLQSSALIKAGNENDELKNIEAEEIEFFDLQAEKIRDDFSKMNRVESFLKAMELPETLEQIQKAAEYLQNGFSELKKQYSREDSDRIVAALDDEETLLTTMDEVEGKLLENIQNEQKEKEQSGDFSYQDLQRFTLMGQGITFFHSLREKKYYEIPLVTESGVTTMNVTVKEGGSDKGTVDISMESEKLGTCKASFSVENRVVTGMITSEKEEDLKHTKDWFSLVMDDFQKAGFQVEQIHFVLGGRSGQFSTGQANAGTEGTSTKALYQLAKIFVQNVQGKEDDV